MSSKPRAKRSGRKPRQPRTVAKRSKSAVEADIRQRGRIIALESRLSVLESFLGIHDDQPPLQEQIDSVEEE